MIIDKHTILLFFPLVQGFFLTVSPEAIVTVGKHAAEKNKVGKMARLSLLPLSIANSTNSTSFIINGLLNGLTIKLSSLQP